MSLEVIILAAGKGKRMHSSVPKVLYPLAGKPLLERVLNTVQALNPEKIHVVYGHEGKKVQDSFTHWNNLHWVEQKELLGTGHAVMQAAPSVKPQNQVLILYGDVPLISQVTLEQLLTNTGNEPMGILTAEVSNPYGYGRIIRDKQGHIQAVIEEKDCTPEQRKINEVNTGFYAIQGKQLVAWLEQVKNDNAQDEYYVTDLVGIAVDEGAKIQHAKAQSMEEVTGINDKKQLAQVERYYQQEMAEALLLKGVSIVDPRRIDIRGDLDVGKDVFIDINVIIDGDVKIGDNSYIGPNCIIKNSRIGKNCEVRANSLIEDSQLDNGCYVGPFARLRPGNKIGEYAEVGNFIEIKNSIIHPHAKVHHLGYVGDADVGKGANIGAGTITCNYDGISKHKTHIGENAFIGSGTELVAPVNIGDGAFIAAGSTVTQDAPANKLTIARAKQSTVQGWESPKKRKQGE